MKSISAPLDNFDAEIATEIAELREQLIATDAAEIARWLDTEIDPETAERIDADIAAFFAESDAELAADWTDPPFGAENSPPLSEHHAAQLKASGIPPEHAAARGYETITDPARLRSLAIVPRVPGLLIPLLRADGSTWGYQYRPDDPRIRNGKPVKYETPKDQRNGLDMPPGMEDLITDPAVSLWVTEGTKKADCGAQYGLAIAALSGVWNWRTKNEKGGIVALADWNDVALNGRTVILAYDGDAAHNSKVAKALCVLAEFLRSRGSKVQYLHLPDGSDGAKVGLDDYLVAGHSTADLWALVKDTQPPLRPLSNNGAVVTPADHWPPPGDSYAVAQKIIEVNDEPLVHWDGTWFTYTGTYYRRISIEDLRDDLYPMLSAVKCIGGNGAEQKWKPNKRKLDDVIDAMRGLLKAPKGTAANTWITGLDDGELMIPCANGLLRVSDRTLLEHTADYFGLFALPYDYDRHATCPRWLRFLAEVFGADTEAIGLLQDWFYYVLTGRTDLQKMLLWIGPKRGGKGTVARLLKALIGADAYAGLSVDAIKSPFGLQEYRHTSLGVFPDEDQIDKSDGKHLVTFIKKVTGEDDVFVNIKYRSPWTGRMAMRFVYQGNTMPVLPDASGAVLTRILPLRTTACFADKPDRTLEPVLTRELPGILNWALKAKLATQRKEFVIPASSAGLLGDIDTYSNPVRQFLLECGDLVFGDDRRVPTRASYDRYEAWRISNGITAYGDARWFGRQLVSAMVDLHPDVTFERKQHNNEPGRPYYYHGMGIVTAATGPRLKVVTRDGATPGSL